jgi:hypothetical protein
MVSLAIFYVAVAVYPCLAVSAVVGALVGMGSR